MEQKITHAIVKIDAGEVVDNLCIGDKVIKKDKQKNKEKFLSEYDINFNKDRKFVKMFEFDYEMLKELNGAESLFLIRLIPFISYDDGIVRRGGRLNGKRLDMNDLVDELDISYDKVRRAISSLTKKGILKTCKIACVESPSVTIKSIIVNPYIIMRGTKMSRNTIELFSDTKWAKYKTDTEGNIDEK